MKYRFLITDYDGDSSICDFRFPNDDAACEAASSMVDNISFVSSVACYRLLPGGNCECIEFMNKIEYGE